MRNRLLGVIGVAVIVIAVGGILKMMRMPVMGQTPTAKGTGGAVASAGPAPRTAWGEPDLQGIWTDPYQTPLQRPARFRDKEYLTDEERAALDKQRTEIMRKDARFERGSERDVNKAYSHDIYISERPTGKRTSLIVDPPDGQIPALTPAAEKKKQTERAYRVALLQATDECKKKMPSCAGGHYGPPSPRRAEVPPFYNTGRTNRVDGPEDRSSAERCMVGGLPDFTGFRRIVQAPGSVSIFYDTGQGQGWERIIPVNGGPHLPSFFRLRFGDSRGHWEGNTLVVDVTNFSPKFSFNWSRENRHLVERWTRLDANTIGYVVTIEDATTWTRPWTVKQEFIRQDEQANRIFYEPRCHEGNLGLPTILLAGRVAERDFARGKGPDPAIENTAVFSNPEGTTDAPTDRGTVGAGGE